MLRIIKIAAITLMLILFLPSFYFRGLAMGKTAGSKPDGLVVNMRVVRSSWDSTGRFEVIVRLVFRNRGRSTLIVLSEPTLARLMTARSLQDLHNNKYESNFGFTWSWPDPLSVNEDLSTSRFRLLEPGDTYETADRKLIPFSLLSSSQSQGKWTGDHVLQAELIMFPFLNSADEISRLKTRWSAQGSLWTDLIATVPLMFSVPEKSSTAH